jgi:hypothetical protein
MIVRQMSDKQRCVHRSKACQTNTSTMFSQQVKIMSDIGDSFTKNGPFSDCRLLLFLNSRELWQLTLDESVLICCVVFEQQNP